MAVPVAHDVLPRPRADRDRHRPPQGQRQRDRRPPVRQRRSAARRAASRSSTWASTLGAFVAPLVCGYLGQRVNWHVGFAAAGVGMVLGLVQYALGRKYLGEAGSIPPIPDRPTAFAEQKRQATRWLGRRRRRCWSCSGSACTRAHSGHGETDRRRRRLSCCSVVSVGFFAWVFLSGGWTRVERNHLIVIGVLFVGYALFCVRVRAGRFHAQPLRRPQHATTRCSAGASRAAGSSRSTRCSSSCSRRCSPGSGSALATTRQGARRAVQVRHRACCSSGSDSPC